jgi:hypothetical protein
MRENTNDLNQNASGTVEDVDDDENNFRSIRSRAQQQEETMDDENHLDDEQPNMLLTEDGGNNNSNSVTLGGQQTLFLAEDEKPVPTNTAYQLQDIDENAIMEKHSSVQQILELLCLLGAGYWRLCQVSTRNTIMALLRFYSLFLD